METLFVAVAQAVSVQLRAVVVVVVAAAVAWDAVASSFAVQLSQKSSTSCCSTFSFELHFVLSSLPASSLDVLARRSFGDKRCTDVLPVRLAVAGRVRP